MWILDLGYRGRTTHHSKKAARREATRQLGRAYYWPCDVDVEGCLIYQSLTDLRRDNDGASAEGTLSRT